MCTSFEMMLNVFLNYVNLVFLLPYQVIYHYKQETYCVISIQVIKGVEVKVFVIIKFSNIIVFFKSYKFWEWNLKALNTVGMFYSYELEVYKIEARKHFDKGTNLPLMYSLLLEQQVHIICFASWIWIYGNIRKQSYFPSNSIQNVISGAENKEKFRQKK